MKRYKSDRHGVADGAICGAAVAALIDWTLIGHSFLHCLALFYIIGACFGASLVLFKYSEYSMYTEEFDPELYAHDHRTEMIIRNCLFYIGLSWYGWRSFLLDED